MQEQSASVNNCEPCENIARIKAITAICKIVSNNDSKCDELEAQRILEQIDNKQHTEKIIEITKEQDNTSISILKKLT